MTKKDYIPLADHIRELRRGVEYPAGDRVELVRQVIDAMARRLADDLRDDNPQFDRRRFLTACGVTS